MNTAAEVAKAASPQGMSVTLDVAALLHALIWPIVVLIIFLVYRKQIPVLVSGIASRLSKLEFGGVSIELAKAKAFVPDWTGGAFDLRHKAASLQVNDSTAATFLTQLREQGDGDYAEVNLGSGKEWLTSRLFIMAIVFARMKGVRCFVFLDDAGGTRRHFAFWAAPERIRWALARRYPWLERAYADAYSRVLTQQQAFVVSNRGKLGNQFSQNDPMPSIELLRDFLERIQSEPLPAPLPAESGDWVVIDDTTNTKEHARWITSSDLEEWLGKDAYRSSISMDKLQGKIGIEQIQPVLAMPDEFVAITSEGGRFEYVIDRDVVVDQVAKQLSIHIAA